MTLSPEQIIKLGDLAKLAVTEQEASTLAVQVDDVLKYIGRVNELETADSIGQWKDTVVNTNVWRADEVRAINEAERNELLASFPSREDDFAKTAPVFKR
ncbi:MAG: aspartyl/glutamyl-tRNA amidotransferase subunit C [Candidatus Komeilibacteria bacterium]|nr:aspartyl/glutamyl-tRNA amidotransferase subunit C [Candidatus Komeilibacteria bacterium]